VQRSALSLSLLVCALDLLVDPPDEPHPVGDGNVVTLPVGESHVIHQEERLLEEDLFITRS